MTTEVTIARDDAAVAEGRRVAPAFPAASRRAHYPLISVGAVLLLLCIWALVTNLFHISPMVMPTPEALYGHFVAMLLGGYAGQPLWAHILASLGRWSMTGLLSGIALAVPVGLCMGYSRAANAALMPIFGFIRPIPPIAFIPLVILWFGIGEFSKILLIFAASFNFTVLASAAGMRAVPEQLVRAGINLGLTRRQLFISVMLPAALPQILTGIKTSTAVSWAIVVAAELIAAQAGLGFIIEDAGTFFRTPEVLIGVVIIGIVGLSSELVITLAERRLLHWQAKG